jgi:hypothetical protein
MKRDVKKRLIRAVNNFNNLYITHAEAVNILTIYGGSKEKAEKIYATMVTEWEVYLTSHNMVNPGIKGVPNTIAQKYFELYGITEKGIRKNLEAIERLEAKKEHE